MNNIEEILKISSLVFCENLRESERPKERGSYGWKARRRGSEN